MATGLWPGPFTGQAFTAASDVDVDHMVPLKNAHDSGAWAWSAAKKRDYANDLSDPQHLIAVDDGANQSKGARGPEAWKPPLQSYWCRYAVDWIGIKSSWELTATAAEWSALSVMLSTCPGGSPTVLPAAAVTPTPTPNATPEVACDPSYPTVCIPPFPPDLNCGDILLRPWGGNIRSATVRAAEKCAQNWSDGVLPSHGRVRRTIDRCRDDHHASAPDQRQGLAHGVMLATCEQRLRRERGQFDDLDGPLRGDERPGRCCKAS